MQHSPARPRPARPRRTPVLVLALLAIACAAAPPAAADAPAAGTSPPAGAIHLTYAVLAHGIRALTLTVDLSFDGDRYEIATATRPAGLFGAFIQNHVDSRATGTFEGDAARPALYHSAGLSRGAERATTVSEATGRPVVTLLTPVETRRDPVPAADTADAIDPLSAFVQLLRRQWRTGSCDGAGRVFDGARLSALSSRTAGTVEVPRSDRSPYSGPALECDVRSQLLAGFLHNDDYARSHLPRQGEAMLAAVLPGVGKLPIRARFDTLEHGEIRLLLTAATFTAAPAGG